MTTSETYLLVVTVLEGRNIELHQGSPSSSITNFNPPSTTPSQVLLLEGRFNDHVLVSDPIALKTNNPKMMNELAWEITRKELHDFRIERKPIKLQLFAADSNGNKHLVGYHVFDLRSAQENDKITHQWKPLLNPKFRGVSTQRPEILCTLKILKSDEDPIENHMFSESSVVKETYNPENGNNCRSNGKHSNGLDDDLQVKETNGMFKVWDSRSHQESDCNQQYAFSVIIAAAKDILYLIPESQFAAACDQDFYFQYNFMGTTIKTASFLDLRSCQFPIEKVTFRLCVPSKEILKSYFTLNPNLELILKRSSKESSKHDEIIGTTTVYLENIVKGDENSSIAGEFHLNSLDESVHHEEKDIQPRVGLLIELEKSSSFSTKDSSFESDPEAELIPYSMSVDVRSLLLSKVTGNFLVQYSYPIFGTAKTIRTNVLNCPSHMTETTFTDGYSCFNFASSTERLKDAFGRAPLLMELVQKVSPGKNIVRGVAKINLIDVIETDADPERKRFFISKAQFLDPSDEEIGMLKVIFVLKEEEATLKTPVNGSKVNGRSSLLKGGKRLDPNPDSSEKEMFQQLLVEAAVEIELWKQQQKKKIKQKLNCEISKRCNNTDNKNMSNMEKELKETLERIKTKEIHLKDKEYELHQMEQVYQERLEKLNEEISSAIQDLKDAYEGRLEKERKTNECLEAENRQLTHEINSLKLSSSINGTSSVTQGRGSLYGRSTSRTQSLVRTNSVPSSVRASSTRT